MNDYEPASSHENVPAHPLSSPPPAGRPDPSASVSAQQLSRWSRAWPLLSSRLGGWIVAAALACAVIALSVALVVSPSASAGPARLGGGFAGGAGPASGAAGGSNARSGPAEGGTTGTVSAVSGSGFTVTTSAGQKVTVNEASATTYQKGTSAASASAVTTGEPVLVLGTTGSTTIMAAHVVVQPPNTGSGTSAAQVVPFQRGAPATSKQVGQVPGNYTEGSGTIVSGSTADKATEAALAAYPGGVVDRVVQLSNGENEVHYLGVNWPHHIFVDQDFQVVGAD